MSRIYINLSPDSCSNDAQSYLDMLTSKSFTPLITKPTRVTSNSSSIIDHILTNCMSHYVFPGIIESALTDHFPVFLHFAERSLS